MAQTIRIDDLAAPRLLPELAAAIEATQPVTMDEAVVLEQARTATGLNDFGPDDFRERLTIWLRSFDADTGLNRLGRAGLFNDCVRLSSTRLMLEDVWKRHPEITHVEIDRPIIIAGLPRSGTTHLVNLLGADSRLQSLPLWESMDPISRTHPVPPSDLDPRRSVCKEQWGQFEALLPYMPSMHEMAPDSIHEDVELLAIDFAGYIPEWLSRAYLWRDYSYTDDQEPHYRYARRVLQYLAWQRGSDRRWLLKSPPHLENLVVLDKVYPDATIVITHRDPLAVIQSAITMMAYGDRMRRDDINLPELASYWIDRIERMLQRCVDERDHIKAIDVRFHEYMADQNATIARVHEAAGLEITPTSRAEIEGYIAANPRGKHGQVVYDLAGDFGIDVPEVRSRFEFYYDRFEVQREPIEGDR